MTLSTLCISYWKYQTWQSTVDTFTSVDVIFTVPVQSIVNVSVPCIHTTLHYACCTSQNIFFTLIHCITIPHHFTKTIHTYISVLSIIKLMFRNRLYMIPCRILLHIFDIFFSLMCNSSSSWPSGNNLVTLIFTQRKKILDILPLLAFNNFL